MLTGIGVSILFNITKNADKHDQTKAVVAGGVFNIFGGIFVVFSLNMGILDAGLATCLGASISLIIMLTHFRTKKNTLKLIQSKGVFKKCKRIISLEFATFFVDLAMGILTILLLLS